MLEVSPIRAFYDNYFWLFREKTSHECGIVDPGDAGPVISYLEANDLELSVILITHHHADHTGGISALRERFDMPVYGPESPNIPEITYPMRDGDIIDVLDTTFRIIEIPGHTLDHIAYHADGLNGQDAILFCGDTLFAGGCGRVFEGTHAMMHQSLKKLADLAGETKVFCAHEYTMANLAFANAVTPESSTLKHRMEVEQERRNRDIPTVPTSIRIELETNPFLRCSEKEIIEAASAYSGKALNSAEDVFAVIRSWKDNF